MVTLLLLLLSLLSLLSPGFVGLVAMASDHLFSTRLLALVATTSDFVSGFQDAQAF